MVMIRTPLLLVSVCIFLFACGEASKEDANKMQMLKMGPQLDDKGMLMLDSNLSEYQIAPWSENPSCILIRQAGVDSPLSMKNAVLAESHAHNKIAYVFANGANCLGAFVTDTQGKLRHFQPTLFCSDSVALKPKVIHILWKASGIPAVLVSESSGERGSALRIRRLDGGVGEVFIDERVSNEDACGPEEDEGILPCFSNTTRIMLPDTGSTLPDTLVTHTTGTVLDGKRLIEVNVRDTILLPWN